jgi:hypothetical protein
MRRYAIWMMAVGALVVSVSCGESPTVIPSPTPPPTTPTTLPSPVPSPSPSPSPAAQGCNLAPGPVTRLAITPRELRTDGVTADVYVRARPNWDEVVCLDRAKSHRLDFNANQRNAEGRESCYIGDVAWRVVDDSRQMVTGSSSRHDDGFIWRYNIEPGGQEASISIEAELDTIKSYPWQSGSGYRREPLSIVTMSANEIARDCLCIFRGNGVYEGARCPKVVQ